MQIKIALPKGRLLSPTSALLEKAGWQLDEYNGSGRLYHLKSAKFPFLRGKVFHEKDIPVQVAIGNYDLGICGRDWIEELLCKYPTTSVIKLKDLGYGYGSLLMVGAAGSLAERGLVRITSEYPNLAESFALKRRLGRFSIFPVWGAAEAYLPESADLALVSQTPDTRPIPGVAPAGKVLDFGACLIANRHSWESKDLFEVVANIMEIASPETRPHLPEITGKGSLEANGDDKIRLALPDGHQQSPTLELLNQAGIKIEDYPSPSGNRRPNIGIDGVAVNVVRPQDMPLQVANGNFDLAITGKDWVTDHRYQFPNSPVETLLDLKFGWVKIVAVVAQDVPANDIAGLRSWVAESGTRVRVATEYTNIADKYARDHHLGRYRVIPTWGATEAFIPEDADMLIENTQTGSTIKRHNLKIIDTLFESTACLITNHAIDPTKRERVEAIVRRFSAAL